MENHSGTEPRHPRRERMGALPAQEDQEQANEPDRVAR